MKTLDNIRNEPAAFGAGGGEVISDTNPHKGPYYILKAQGGDVVITTGALPTGWTGALDGLTITDGDMIVIDGMHDITLASGKALAYRHAPQPPIPS